MKIGFIGLGIMGTPMAQHLLTAGHEMFVRTRSKVPEALSAAQVCATNADVARHADIIFLMLPDTPDVEAVLFGKDGVAEGLSQDKIVVDMRPCQAAKWARRPPASPSWWAAQKPRSTPSSLCLN
jgi:2-hydroxy-3-oxopropionate reductase